MDLIKGLLFIHSKCKIMKYSNFIGIDVSKRSLSVSCWNSSSEVFYCDIDNTSKSILKFIKRYNKEFGSSKETIVCLEYTGVYTYYILQCFYEQGFAVWIEHALNIKHSMRMTRGKNDKIDSSRIAEYAFRYQDKLVKWEPKRPIVDKLKKLFSIRESLIKSKKQTSLSITQHKGYEEKGYTKLSSDFIKPILEKVEKQVEKVNDEIQKLIDSDERLTELKKLISSVPGVGDVVTWKLLVTTNEFKDFTDGKKFACYSGVVPFQHQSGTSLRSKARVSHMANKEVKTLLHLSVVSIISRGKGELFEYYQRKVKEGKVKMSVINAVRNKIIQRVFACVKNNREYEETYMHSLA